MNKNPIPLYYLLKLKDPKKFFSTLTLQKTIVPNLPVF